MKRFIPFFLIFFIFGWQKLFAQSDSTVVRVPERDLLVKVYPSFSGSSIKGGILAVEKGIDSTRISIWAGIKYFSGADVDFGSSGIVHHARYFRLEVQPRYYPVWLLHNFYIAPLVSVNNKFQPAAGLLFGIQEFIAKTVPVELNIGIQNSTATDNFDSPIFLRFQLGIGLSFKTKQ